MTRVLIYKNGSICRFCSVLNGLLWMNSRKRSHLWAFPHPRKSMRAGSAFQARALTGHANMRSGLTIPRQCPEIRPAHMKKPAGAIGRFFRASRRVRRIHGLFFVPDRTVFRRGSVSVRRRSSLDLCINPNPVCKNIHGMICSRPPSSGRHARLVSIPRSRAPRFRLPACRATTESPHTPCPPPAIRFPPNRSW